MKTFLSLALLAHGVAAAQTASPVTPATTGQRQGGFRCAADWIGR